MNWITKIIKASEKIKTAFHQRAQKKILLTVTGLRVVKVQY